MTDTRWTTDDVTGFVTRVNEFYTTLTDEERRMFADTLREGVLKDTDVTGYTTTTTMTTTTLTTALTDYLLTQTT